MTRPPFPKKGKTADSKPAIAWYQDISKVADSAITNIEVASGELTVSTTAPTSTIGLADDVTLPGTGGVLVPAGTTAERPSSPSNGQIRYNSDDSDFEFYKNGSWVQTDEFISSATVEDMENETGSDIFVRPDRLQYGPGVAKAWITFNGVGTVSIIESHNVLALTEDAQGEYTIDFDVTFADADSVVYSCNMGYVDGYTTRPSYASSTIRTTTSVDFITEYVSGSTRAESEYNSLVAFGEII